MHKEVHGQNQNAQVKRLVKELQICELENDPPKFLTRTDGLGIISRMLLEDLEHAIDSNQLYLLYQPQMDGNGKCLGAEALLRWNHSAYGFIYLQSNHFNVVKLDGSLVKNILTSKTSQAIISSIVSLGNKLGINVVAEYVETAEIRDRLRELGCTWYQGYYFSKPVPLDDFIACLKKNNEE